MCETIRASARKRRRVAPSVVSDEVQLPVVVHVEECNLALERSSAHAAWGASSSPAM